MPLRWDFDVEPENEFETIIKDIAFFDKDEATVFQDLPEEKELKLNMLRNYCTVLDRRNERKQFAFDRNFTMFNNLMENERQLDPVKLEILSSNKRFARFLQADDFECFLEGIFGTGSFYLL